MAELNPFVALDEAPTTRPQDAPVKTGFGVGRFGPWQQDTERGVVLDRFYGKPDPTGIHVRKFEKPWMRQLAFIMASCGGRTSLKDAAKELGVAYATALDVAKQPFFQETVQVLMAEYGGKDIMDLFKGEAVASLLTMVELRDDAKAPASVRQRAAADIMDRACGKAVQRIESDAVVRSGDPVADVENLKRQNAALRERLDLPAPEGCERDTGAAVLDLSHSPGPGTTCAQT